MKIWFDGKIVTKEEAKISVYDHGLLYGDGCFEGIRFYNGKIYRLSEHIDRLFYCMHYLMINLPWTHDEVCAACLDTVAQSGLSDGYIRLVVTRGKGDLGLDPARCPRPSMAIIVQNIKLYSQEMYDNGLKVITSSYRRAAPDVLCQQVKSLNYLNSVCAKIECKQHGAGEALILNDQGNVAECSSDNIFIVKNGVICTPPVTEGALNGITRQSVIELCKLNDIPMEEKVINRFDVVTADECFLTGTAAEVIAVSSLDGRLIGTGKAGPVTQKILALYHELVRA